MDTSAEHRNEGQLIHPKKMLIWLSIVSIIMLFAGLSSYLIVRKASGNWAELEIPTAFQWSTIVIVIGSILQQTGLFLFKKGKESIAFMLVILTLLSGVAFMMTQNEGYRELIDQGFLLGGASGNSSADIIYVVVWAHICHILVALLYLIALLFVMKFPKFTDSVKRRFENSTTFWHFLGLLWIYLYVFLLVNYN